MSKKNRLDTPIPFTLADLATARPRVNPDPRAARHVFADEAVSVAGFAVPDCERDVPIRWRVA